MHDQAVTTIERFILDQEHRFPEATGELSNLLYDIALAAKIIAAAIRRAGLVNILGSAGRGNVQGEEQQKLDVFANETMTNCAEHTGRVCVMASEEDEDIIPVPEHTPSASTPSSSTRSTARRTSTSTAPSAPSSASTAGCSLEGRGKLADVLQPGCKQVAAGLRDLRLQHHAGLHHRAGRAWVHPRSHHRRVPAVPSTRS